MSPIPSSLSSIRLGLGLAVLAAPAAALAHETGAPHGVEEHLALYAAAAAALGLVALAISRVSRRPAKRPVRIEREETSERRDPPRR